MFDKIGKDDDFTSKLSHGEFFYSTTNILKQAENKSPLVLTEDAAFLFNNFPALFMTRTQDPEFVIFEETNNGGASASSPPLSATVSNTINKNTTEFPTIDSLMDSLRDNHYLGFPAPQSPDSESEPEIDPGPSKPNSPDIDMPQPAPGV
jgi:hypothetical protein